MLNGLLAQKDDIFEYVLCLTNCIDVTNIQTLIRLSDKYDIESLRREIDVNIQYIPVYTKKKICYALWISTRKVASTYDIWETAAKLKLNETEQLCRNAALVQIRKIIQEGEGLEYFLRREVRPELLTILVRELLSQKVQSPEYAVLQQMM